MSIDNPIEQDELDQWMAEREYTLSRGFAEQVGKDFFVFLEMQPITSLKHWVQEGGCYGIYLAYCRTYDKAFKRWALEQYQEYLEFQNPYEPEEA